MRSYVQVCVCACVRAAACVCVCMAFLQVAVWILDLFVEQGYFKLIYSRGFLDVVWIGLDCVRLSEVYNKVNMDEMF